MKIKLSKNDLNEIRRITGGRIIMGESHMVRDRRYQHPSTLANYELFDLIKKTSDLNAVRGLVVESITRLKNDSEYIRVEKVKLNYKFKIGDIVEVNEGAYWNEKEDRWARWGEIIGYGQSDKTPSYVIKMPDRNNWEWSYHENELRLALNPHVD